MFVSMLWHGSEVIAVYGPYETEEEAGIAGVKFMVEEYANNWDNEWDLTTEDDIGIGTRHSPNSPMEMRVWWDTIELNKVR